MKRYIVKLVMDDDEGVIDFAATNDVAEAINYATAQAFQRGVQDVRILDSQTNIVLVCERLE